MSNRMRAVQTAAAEYLQTMPTDVLASVVRHEIDLNDIAASELADRGCGRNGEWLGFEEAREPPRRAKALRESGEYWDVRASACLLAVDTLRRERDRLRGAGAGDAADYIARALKSVQGAANHARRMRNDLDRKRSAA